jgi:pimeloyl-ACP methyl ester carboxylesterase
MTRETLVMLPGMMCDARLFAPQIVALDSRYDIVVPALCSPNSIEGLARRILEDVTAPRFNLLGLSMGGIVAMVMAGLAPARVARLALLDSNHRADAPERRHIRNRQIAAVREGRLRGVIAKEMKPNYLAVASRGDKALLDTMLAMAVDLGPACFINQSEALRDRRDQSEVLSRYAGPVLLLCGSEDALCPPSRHREIAELCAEARLVIIPGAGHIVTLEQPDETIREIDHWLDTPEPFDR